MSASESASELTTHIATRVAIDGYAAFHIGYGPCAVPDCPYCPSRHPWTYTVGLVERGQPELVLFGLDPTSTHYWIERVRDEMAEGKPLPPHNVLEFDEGLVRLDDVPAQWLMIDRGRMALWFSYYGRWVKAPAVRQLVWADEDDRFPDDPLCDPSVVHEQPLLSLDPRRFPKAYSARRNVNRARHRRRR